LNPVDGRERFPATIAGLFFGVRGMASKDEKEYKKEIQIHEDKNANNLSEMRHRYVRATER
jgi:hypothetical protein